MNIEKVIDWFKAAKPHPTEKDKATQIGAHFEEVSEMMWSLSWFNLDAILKKLKKCAMP